MDNKSPVDINVSSKALPPVALEAGVSSYTGIISSLAKITDKPRTRCYIGDPFVSTEVSSSEFISSRINYFLYSLRTETQGKPFYLFSHRRITPGEAELYLAPLSDEDKQLLVGHLPDRKKNVTKICNDLEIPTELDNKPLTPKERFIHAVNIGHNFVKERPFLTNEEFALLTADIDLSSLVALILRQGYKKDERLLLLYKLQLLLFDESVSPKGLMPYQSHAIAFTNSKCGKTSTADSVGIRIDRLTPARFLGFSDAKDKHPGDVDRQNHPFFIDEIGDTKDDSVIARHALNLLELGTVNVSTGKQSFLIVTWSPIIFHGNIIDIISAMAEFESLIAKISLNPTATGSRFALVLFGDSYLEATKVADIGPTLVEKALAVWRSLEEKARPAITNFFFAKRAQDWLNEAIDVYSKELDQLIIQVPQLSTNTKAFITSQKSAYKHIRGAALKLAIIDYITDFLSTAVDDDGIIEAAETYLTEIVNINLESFSTIASGYQVNKTALKRHVYTTMPEYAKVLVQLAQIIITHFPALILPNKTIVLDANTLKDPYSYIGLSGKYASPSGLLQSLPKDKRSVNKNLQYFGIELETRSNQDWIVIKDANELLQPY